MLGATSRDMLRNRDLIQLTAPASMALVLPRVYRYMRSQLDERCTGIRQSMLVDVSSPCGLHLTDLTVVWANSNDVVPRGVVTRAFWLLPSATGRGRDAGLTAARVHPSCRSHGFSIEGS